MDPSEQDLSTAMLLAVENRNLIAFRQVLAQGFDVRSYVRSNDSSDYMPFIEKVARSRFSDALRVLLIETQPCVVSREDAVRAFDASVATCTCSQRTTIVVFIEASILGTLPVLSLTDCYRYAMEYRCKRNLIRRVVDVQGFDANCRIELSAGTWERPVHSAIRRDDCGTATRLLQLGAEVDAPDCYGITALMIACGRVCVYTVELLLSHGADPNSADGIQVNTWPLAVATEFPGSMFSKPNRPVFLNFKKGPKRWQVTKDADTIIGLMVNAGLRPSPGGWLQRTAIVAKMSREARQVMRDIIDRMPKPCSEVANVQGRLGVGPLMKGNEDSGSNEAVNDFTHPSELMEQLNIDAMISREIEGRQDVGQLENEKVGSGSNETVEDDCMLPFKLMDHLSNDVPD